MNQEQKEALFGASARYADHKVGDVVQVQQGNDIKQGKIIHVRAPGPAPVSGQEMPTIYVVDTRQGIPLFATPSQIIHGSFTAVIASYGYPENGCMLSRKAAENLAVNVQGQIIDTEQGRLRVLSARIEGDERAGQVIAECEAVIESEQNQEGE